MRNDLELRVEDRTPAGPVRSGAVARGLWEGWKRFAKRLGDVQARVLLVIFYFLFFAPFALLARWSRDPLGIKPESPKGWRPKTQRAENWAELAMRQF